VKDKQFITREVSVGKVKIGNKNPVCLQSMTSTLTQDVEATVAQIKRVVDAGGELIRLTTPTIKDAEILKFIRTRLLEEEISIPLIADVHFSTKVAEVAAQYADKVRINPGNYTEANKQKVELSQAEYLHILDRIKKNLSPLIKICKTNHTSIRIGSNHGSLSQRILNRYGNTAQGMVEAAMEFLRIFQSFDFHEVVVSMKASNVKIMIEANRLLVRQMMEEGMNYPVHLGVTEAGDAEDGRIKSAAGIGVLLCDHIGDTIRVSLTEEPENEIPVAAEIVHFAKQAKTHKNIDFALQKKYFNRKNKGLTEANTIAVIVDPKNRKEKADFWASESHFHSWDGVQKIPFTYHIDEATKKEIPVIIEINKDSLLSSVYQDIVRWRKQNPELKIVLKIDTDKMIEATIHAAYFLVDGLVDGLWARDEVLAFNILQATGERISKTEYIACPSCGRTLFNIQEVLQKIKRETGDFKGLKIGVMGCIVNGPGEMADADYGYVGAGAGKVHLYQGQELIKKNIDEKDAIAELLNLINQK
jgi:(E)-4-hydroxy-3-methylbut-2-enyl-diphosphate synthase